MELRGQRATLRPWQSGDEDPLVRHADDHAVWRNLADRFPHPYTEQDARDWIALMADQQPPMNFAILVDGEAVGGIGVERRQDIHRHVGDVGFWLGRDHWGRGIATEALGLLAAYAFAELGLERLQATVLERNPASCRVLEKAGFVREARRRRHAIKEGEVMDTWLYARVRDEAG